MTMRVRTPSASVTGFFAGLVHQPHSDGGHVARLDLRFDGFEHVVVGAGQCDTGQIHEDCYGNASENKFPRHFSSSSWGFCSAPSSQFSPIPAARMEARIGSTRRVLFMAAP